MMMMDNWNEELGHSTACLQRRNFENFLNATRKVGYMPRVKLCQRIMDPPVHLRSNPEPKGTEVFACIPTDVFEDELYPFFSKIGPIYRLRLLMSSSGLYNKGIVYVTYQDPAHAKNAVEKLNNVEIKSMQKVTVEKSIDKRTLFIGGLPTNKTKLQILNELERKGIMNIKNVIIHKAYYRNNVNRGYAFVEMRTHDEAAEIRRMFKDLILFGHQVVVDWAIPLEEWDEDIMSNVKILFISNLNILLPYKEFRQEIHSIIQQERIEKLYKCRNYSFVHFTKREYAEEALQVLSNFYRSTDVLVEWAKPQARRNTRLYREKMLRLYKSTKSSRYNMEDKNMFSNTPSENLDYQPVRFLNEKVDENIVENEFKMPLVSPTSSSLSSSSPLSGTSASYNVVDTELKENISVDLAQLLNKLHINFF